METINLYQILDDLQSFADNLGSEWMKERLHMLEAQVAVLEMQSINK